MDSSESIARSGRTGTESKQGASSILARAAGNFFGTHRLEEREENSFCVYILSFAMEGEIRTLIFTPEAKKLKLKIQMDL